MEAPDVPLDETQDHINEHAHESRERWVLGVALSTAILAAVAAIASLLAGQRINEGMIYQIRESDQWSYYQAKGIKAGVLESKDALLVAMGKSPDASDAAKAAQYGKEQAALSADAKTLGQKAEADLEGHEKLASAVTFFQIGIAISAISVLTKRRAFWYVGLVSGCVGLMYFGLAFK